MARTGKADLLLAAFALGTKVAPISLALFSPVEGVLVRHSGPFNVCRPRVSEGDVGDMMGVALSAGDFLGRHDILFGVPWHTESRPAPVMRTPFLVAAQVGWGWISDGLQQLFLGSEGGMPAPRGLLLAWPNH